MERIEDHGHHWHTAGRYKVIAVEGRKDRGRVEAEALRVVAYERDDGWRDARTDAAMTEAEAVAAAETFLNAKTPNSPYFGGAVVRRTELLHRDIAK